MASLGLVGPPRQDADAVVRHLLAVQSQDYGPAKWSIGHRAAATSDASLDAQVAAGSLLRTHVLRPTWHFVLPGDIGWLLQITGPRVQALNAPYLRRLELDGPLLRRCYDLIASALERGGRLTRREITSLLERNGIDTSGLRPAFIILSAELEGLICSGGLRGRQHTYALLSERLPGRASLSTDEALAELTLRYFRGHGPATARDLRWWASLTLNEVRRGLALVAGSLRAEEMDGVTYYSAGEAGALPHSGSVAHLLQAFDEYFVGYSESKYFGDISGLARSLPSGAITNKGVVLIDSQVAGGWKRRLQKDELLVTAALFRPAGAEELAALAGVAQEQARFLGAGTVRFEATTLDGGWKAAVP